MEKNNKATHKKDIIDRRNEVRFPVSLRCKCATGQDSQESVLGLIKEFSLGGFRAVFDRFESEPNSHLNLQIQRPKRNIFVPAIAQVRWKRPVENKWEVGFQLRSFFPDVKSEILKYSRKKQKMIGFLIKSILITLAIFLTLYFLTATGIVRSIRSPRIATRRIWTLLRGSFLGGIAKISPGTYKINGIGYSMDNLPNYVIIDNNIYNLNDYIYGGKIINISQDEVTIQFQDKQEVYSVGQTIKR